MGIKIYQVDSFTNKPFSGNPAGVCILDNMPDEIWMQNVAMEMNLAETSFICKDNNKYNLRWFTPETEVDLCGHATLAGVHILWEKGFVPSENEIKFSTKSGILTCKKEDSLIKMNFPAEIASKTDIPDNLIEGLGINPLYVGKNRFDYLVEAGSENEILNIQPDLNLLSKLDMRGVIVTSKSNSPDYDFVSRFFAPGVGINEDPVTGSAHCCLGPYWAEKLGKNDFKALQLSKRRGELYVTVYGDRVLIAGKAVTVIEGEILH